jgi:SAM-dependent methyltransferase
MKKKTVKTWSTPSVREESRLIPCALCGGERFRFHFSCDGFSYVRCGRCGLVQMNPQPLKKAVLRRYQEGHGEAYLAYELANEPAFLRLQELALEDAGFPALEAALKTRGTPKALDSGCAAGALLELLRSRGWETTGVEISPAADYARRKRGLDVRSLPLEENRFPENHFDLVWASHLIEHLAEPQVFVREAYRICAPGGHFFVTTPNIAGFQARLFRDRWRSAIFDHLYLFSIKTLSRLLRDNGFSPERVLTWGGLAAGTAPPRLKALADRWAKRLGAGDVMLIRAVKNGHPVGDRQRPQRAAVIAPGAEGIRHPPACTGKGLETASPPSLFTAAPVPRRPRRRAFLPPPPIPC